MHDVNLKNPPSVTNLKQLLVHYFKDLHTERSQWQPRVMQLDGIEQKELTTLHGLLIAYGWIEQNNGYADLLENQEKVTGCYRITHSGTREVRGFHESLEEEFSLGN